MLARIAHASCRVRWLAVVAVAVLVASTAWTQEEREDPKEPDKKTTSATPSKKAPEATDTKKQAEQESIVITNDTLEQRYGGSQAVLCTIPVRLTRMARASPDGVL